MHVVPDFGLAVIEVVEHQVIVIPQLGIDVGRPAGFVSADEFVDCGGVGGGVVVDAGEVVGVVVFGAVA